MKLIILILFTFTLSFCGTTQPKDPQMAKALNKTLDSTPKGDHMVSGMRRKSMSVSDNCSNQEMEKSIAKCSADNGIINELRNTCRSNELSNFQYIDFLQNYKQMACK